uniref:Uncharacterized protein n=1 Tax=Zea mays TaxID=4577 RepID=B4FK53_MAIZE|nr:unknown [Zea mays]
MWTRWSATWWRPEEPRQVVAIAGKERLLSDVCTFIAVNVIDGKRWAQLIPDNDSLMS